MSTENGNWALQQGLSSGVLSRVSGLASVDSRLPTPDSRLRNQKVAEEFASLLLLEVMKAMRATLSGEGLFADDSSSRDMYTSLADTEVTRALAKGDRLGLGKFILQGMMKSQGLATGDRLQGPTDRFLLSSPLFPVSLGEISSAFGLRPDPLERDERFHAGVDIAAPVGSPVKAVAAGSVIFSGWAEGYGNLVTIDHGDGMTTRYAHTGTNLVAAGQPVAAGQEIALVGTSGRSTGPHLHFEVRKKGEPINPQSFLSRGRS